MDGTKMGGTAQPAAETARNSRASSDKRAPKDKTLPCLLMDASRNHFTGSLPAIYVPKLTYQKQLCNSGYSCYLQVTLGFATHTFRSESKRGYFYAQTSTWSICVALMN